MEDVLRVRLKIKTAHLCCLYFIYKLGVFFNVCFHLESKREHLQVIHESLGLCWVQPGRDHAGTIRDSHAESLASLLQRQMCLDCFSIYAFVSGQVGGEAPAKGGKKWDGTFSS